MKTAVCSRSVANRVYLTNHRSKKRKVIMHHTQGAGVRVPNSSPYSSYSNLQGFGYVFLFIGGSAEELLGTVNEQRQGITMIVVSCLFALQNKACFVRTWPPLQDGRLKTTSFQTKVFHCISQKSMFQ